MQELSPEEVAALENDATPTEKKEKRRSRKSDQQSEKKSKKGKHKKVKKKRDHHSEDEDGSQSLSKKEVVKPTAIHASFIDRRASKNLPLGAPYNFRKTGGYDPELPQRPEEQIGLVYHREKLEQEKKKQEKKEQLKRSTPRGERDENTQNSSPKSS